MPVLRILLLPFAFLYKLITDFRNHLYDIGSKKSIEFNAFIIGVGNLTVGGTGKTPFVELLVRELKHRFRLAVLSRGYKRKTHGFKLADEFDDSNTLGDEPFQYFTKFRNEVKVAVGEDRALAISELLFQDEKTEIIILDDAYQHRRVKPQINILLNDYNRPFYNDFVLPSGLLRESRKHAARADLVIVTKCPVELEDIEMQEINQQIDRYTQNNTPIFFASIKYLSPKQFYGKGKFSKNVFLFSGIANAKPLSEYVDKNYNLIGHKEYPDHYSFTKKDLKEIVDIFDSLAGTSKCLLTTEKDMARLMSMKEEAGILMQYPVFYLPIELYFLRNGDFFANYLNETISQSFNNNKFN